MKKLFIAAAALSAFAAFACVPVFAWTSRKTGFSEFYEFDDLTIKRNTMDHTYTVFSGYSRCRPVSQTINNYSPLGNNCYIGGFSLDTEQLTVQCTSISRDTLKNHNSPSGNCSAASNRSIGTYEGTQLKARLA